MFLVIGVWRSLVSRLVRVQEASGSNPDTPTRNPESAFTDSGFFFLSYGRKYRKKHASSLFLSRKCILFYAAITTSTRIHEKSLLLGFLALFYCHYLEIMV